jgi:hypothetical protein
MRRYSSRLVLGVLLGLVFAMTNMAFVWTSKTLTSRLDNTHQSVVGTETAPPVSKLQQMASDLKLARFLAAEGWTTTRLAAVRGCLAAAAIVDGGPWLCGLPERLFHELGK